MLVIKRNGVKKPFQRRKVRLAISKANLEVPTNEQASGEQIDEICSKIEDLDMKEIHVETIQDFIEKQLMTLGLLTLAKKYIIYRYNRMLTRKANTTDESILSLVKNKNKGVMEENSNKNAFAASTQRDLIAGEVSKDLTWRMLLPKDIVEAHEQGVFHFHDADYFLQSIFNCFDRSTKFITVDGTKSFNDFSDGDIVYVYTHTGNIKKAIVKNYGKQVLYKMVFKRGKSSFKEVLCTANHRWLLNNGTQTTSLQPDDRLLTTPTIECFDFDSASDSEKHYWCLGFGLGDGSDFDNGKGTTGIKIRLCGERKNSYYYRFLQCGYTTNQVPSVDYDYCTYMLRESKQEFLDNKEWLNLSRGEKIALFNGLICADGEFRDKDYPSGISTADIRIAELVYDLAECAGYYLGTSRVVEGSTNFVEDRHPLIHIQFARRQYYKQPWILKYKEFYGTDDVWCLEVEDDHSFILSNGMVTGNCCLIAIGDMLDNGTMINGVLIETPKSFKVACNVMTQIIASVASNQYGGQSVAIKHLGKYLAISREKYRISTKERWNKIGIKYTEEQLNKEVDDLLKQELKDGVQTIQYQVNTLLTTNGQSPFLTLFLQIDDNDPYVEEVAMIVEEIIKQRIQGVKNKKGVYVTPAFPKLVYVLDENNCLKGGKYDYITKLCAECNVKRIYPDYISAKVMRELHEGQVYSCMGCRSFLSEWKVTEDMKNSCNLPDKVGDYKWEGRFNQGVVSLNLPQIGLVANGDMDLFWEELEKRLALCFKALMCRHKALEGTLSNTSEIHWQNGAIARLKEGETIDKLLHDGYSTLSLGYIGLYETTVAMLGVSHTTPEGKEFAKKVLTRLKKATEDWKAETSLGFGLYGTPAESLCYRFCEIDKKKFGVVEDITDKGYYTNSYHIDVRENINAFDKFTFESEFQKISTGGCISYVELPNLANNLLAVEELIKFIYEKIMYAEFNGKSDYCLECDFDGEIVTVPDKDGNLVWECPQCGNRNQSRMIVTRRTCGYLGHEFWNVGKTKEIASRVLHL